MSALNIFALPYPVTVVDFAPSLPPIWFDALKLETFLLSAFAFEKLMQSVWGMRS